MTITFRGPCRNRVLNPRQPLLQGSRQEVVPVLPVILVRTTSWGMIGNTISDCNGIKNRLHLIKFLMCENDVIRVDGLFYSWETDCGDDVVCLMASKLGGRIEGDRKSTRLNSR